MFYGDTPQDIREVFFECWSKYQNKSPLTPLEDQVLQVILAHPEYHDCLANPETYKERQYHPELGEVNPFLHMGLHLAIREQVSTNRPAGIVKTYTALVNKYKNPLEVEHLMMEQLAECLWLSQKNNQAPDENHYLSTLNTL